MKTKYWYWLWRTFLGPSRLRRKFVRTFLFAGLIPLVLMGLVSIYLVNVTHRTDVAALEENVARQVGTEIAKLATETLVRLEFTVSFDEFAPISFEQQGFFLREMLNDNPALSEISLICLTPLQCDVGRETARWMRQDSDFVPLGELREMTREPGFLAARRNETYFGPARFGEDGAEVTLAAPVVNRRAQIISVLLVRMRLSGVERIVAEQKLGESGYVYVIDRERRVIAHPNPALVGTIAQTFPISPSSISEGAVNLGRYRSFGEVPVSGAAIPIEDPGWISVAEWPDEEADSVIERILAQILLFAVLAFIAIAVIASWVALKLIEPIAALRQGTMVIGDGNFNYRVAIKTGDELEDLGMNLNKMAEHLKGLEEVRDLRLRTTLLAESLRKEQELSKTKDQFITTVSHQFNTPLSVIKWALTSLHERGAKPEQIREATRLIGKSEEDISGIVNDLLTLTQVGFHYEKSNTKRVEVRKLVEKSAEYLAEIIRRKKLKLSVRETGETTVVANEFTFGKAIDNLLDNAVAYSNDGDEIVVEIKGEKETLTLMVADRGIGIPKEDQPRIFEQFFRAKNAVQKKNVGTGLGLFIVKTIVEGHGGKTRFTSVENQGSTFFIELPRL